MPDADAVSKYIAKAKKLVKAKSLGGMAIVIPLAISALVSSTVTYWRRRQNHRI